MGIEVSGSLACKMDELFREKFSSVAELGESVKFTLSELGRMGFRMAIISNFDVGMVEALLRRFGIESYFELVVGVDSTGFRKAKFEPFKYALRELGLEPCEVVMVGDDEEQDIIPANMLGITTIKVSGEEGRTAAKFNIKRLSELPDLLCKLNATEE